ncbi:hypothetical protein BIV57_20445 [Mangrovactinospora gilvigrisea]|uniref:Putative Flp pilus-assembly TadG-like N-terminal domain-containing protein n=1 Tax=Mangrovactinospora gilvigrisea TaxID=1428644 RepID=A0A1J7BQC6_9ACTN|nr:pilus assembly protein TadG-related protein [Mangrovactinospora gilvigrisea]OIV35649.1 hypothetical protein BIV57_20445 [Mangrovactinospora gilvigrisea]
MRFPAASRDRERGSAAIFTILITLVTLGLAALVVDGGLAIAQRERAMDIAEQSARKVADNIDIDTWRASGRLVIKDGDCGGQAAAIASGFHVGSAAITTCSVSADAVTVGVRITYRPVLLGFFTNSAFTASGTATAHPEAGINNVTTGGTP